MVNTEMDNYLITKASFNMCTPTHVTRQEPLHIMWSQIGGVGTHLRYLGFLSPGPGSVKLFLIKID